MKIRFTLARPGTLPRAGCRHFLDRLPAAAAFTRQDAGIGGRGKKLIFESTQAVPAGARTRPGNFFPLKSRLRPSRGWRQRRAVAAGGGKSRCERRKLRGRAQVGRAVSGESDEVKNIRFNLLRGRGKFDHLNALLYD